MSLLRSRNRGSTRSWCEQEVTARDRELDNRFGKDLQITAIRGARAYRGDRLIRVARLHKLLDPEAGPLIAVRLRTSHVVRRLAASRPTSPHACWELTAHRCRDSMRPARSPGSAAVACTAITLWKARFLAAAFFGKDCRPQRGKRYTLVAGRITSLVLRALPVSIRQRMPDRILGPVSARDNGEVPARDGGNACGDAGDADQEGGDEGGEGSWGMAGSASSLKTMLPAGDQWKW